MYLVIKNNGLKSYYNTSTCNKPRLVYKTGTKTAYVPLSTSDYGYNKLIVSNYRAMEYASTSGSTSYGTSYHTRVSTSSVYNHTTTSSGSTGSSTYTSSGYRYYWDYSTSTSTWTVTEGGGGGNGVYYPPSTRQDNDATITYNGYSSTYADRHTYLDTYQQVLEGKETTYMSYYTRYWFTYYGTYRKSSSTSFSTASHVSETSSTLTSTWGGVKTITTSKDYYTTSSSYDSYNLTSSYSYETWR